MAERWHESAELCAKSGVKLVWEFEPGFLFNKPSEVVRMAYKVDHPNFSVMFDSCHGYMCAVVGARQMGQKETLPGGVVQFIHMLTGKIGAVHFIDSDGTLHDNETSTHAPFGKGVLDFDAIAKAFLEAGLHRRVVAHRPVLLVQRPGGDGADQEVHGQAGGQVRARYEEEEPMAEKMKAQVFYESEKMELEDIPVPRVTDIDVLVQGEELRRLRLGHLLLLRLQPRGHRHRQGPARAGPRVHGRGRRGRLGGEVHEAVQARATGSS